MLDEFNEGLEKEVRAEKKRKKNDEFELEKDFYSLSVVCFLKETTERKKLHSSKQADNVLKCIALLAM